MRVYADVSLVRFQRDCDQWYNDDDVVSSWLALESLSFGKD
jgi:hypothetical protein